MISNIQQLADRCMRASSCCCDGGGIDDGRRMIWWSREFTHKTGLVGGSSQETSLLPRLLANRVANIGGIREYSKTLEVCCGIYLDSYPAIDVLL